uniref:C2H2-type domain-containing protein n=1 Tax=Sinocyclocheilus anshuiensis TaxID=1608454 RepID=A0A671MMU3_9TELE
MIPIQQKHEAKPPTPGAIEGKNNCRPVGGNVCLPQILDSLETKKHKKLECRSKLNQNVPLTESNSSTIEIKSSDALNNTQMQITTSSPSYLKHKQKGVNQCSICLKNFPYPSKLTRHILSHTDSRPFKCQVCLKSFRYQGHLQLHVRIHKKKGWNIIAGHLEHDHTVSFIYDCPVCHKQFGAPSKLKRHCLIHTDQRPFQCSICCCAFRECSHLKVHVRTHNVPSSAYSSKLSEGQWMEENQENEEEQEASVTTQ